MPKKPKHLRRRAGSKRWVCPHCGYPSAARKVKNNTCPRQECGRSADVVLKDWTLSKDAPQPKKDHTPKRGRRKRL